MVESKHAGSDNGVSRLLISCHGEGFPDKLVSYVYEFDTSAIDFNFSGVTTNRTTVVQHQRAFAAFIPAPQAFGPAGVGIMRGPNYVDFDFNAAKRFRIDEQRSLQFRTEFFNAFNHANFNPPDIPADATTLGQILSAQNA